MKNKTLIKTEYLFDGHWYDQQGILGLVPNLVELSKELDSKSIPTQEALEASQKLSRFLNRLPVRFTYK